VFRVGSARLLDKERSCWIRPSRDTLRAPTFIVRRGSQAVDGTGLEKRFSLGQPSAVFQVFTIESAYPGQVIQPHSRAMDGTRLHLTALVLDSRVRSFSTFFTSTARQNPQAEFLESFSHLFEETRVQSRPLDIEACCSQYLGLESEKTGHATGNGANAAVLAATEDALSDTCACHLGTGCVSLAHQIQKVAAHRKRAGRSGITRRNTSACGGRGVGDRLRTP
jgi:hypothetical protein